MPVEADSIAPLASARPVLGLAWAGSDVISLENSFLLASATGIFELDASGHVSAVSLPPGHVTAMAACGDRLAVALVDEHRTARIVVVDHVRAIPLQDVPLSTMPSSIAICPDTLEVVLMEATGELTVVGPEGPRSALRPGEPSLRTNGGRVVAIGRGAVLILDHEPEVVDLPRGRAGRIWGWPLESLSGEPVAVSAGRLVYFDPFNGNLVVIYAH